METFKYLTTLNNIMGFEDSLAHTIFNTSSEKTFIDKILARQDVDKIEELISKPKLKREDLLKLLYLLSGNEAKLLNYGAWDRYVILKFFVWIREFIKIAELLYDYQDDLKKKKRKLTPRTDKLLYNNERLIEHNAKFLIDLYFNIARTTLSLGATGLMELLKNKYEVVYPGQPLTQQGEKSDQRGLLAVKR